MSMTTDIQKLNNVRTQKCNLEVALRGTRDEKTRKNIQVGIDNAYQREQELSVQFTRMYLTDIHRMLDREARMRRIVKEFMPRE